MQPTDILLGFADADLRKSESTRFVVSVTAVMEEVSVMMSVVMLTLALAPLCRLKASLK